MNHFIDPVVDNDLREAYEKLAEHLTGKTIILRFSKPLALHATGESFMGPDGISRINIAPGVSARNSYDILLEEIAHIRLSHVQKATAVQLELTRFVDARQVNSHPERKKQEDEAEALANQWREYAYIQTQRKPLLFGMTEKEITLLFVNTLLACRWLAR